MKVSEPEDHIAVTANVHPTLQTDGLNPKIVTELPPKLCWATGEVTFSFTHSEIQAKYSLSKTGPPDSLNSSQSIAHHSLLT